MAEFVQQSIEEMLPELEQMERIDLFSSKETRTILKKRTNCEYKLRRKTKQKDDYLQYLQYEMNLLALIKKRRQKTSIYYKKAEIDLAVINRIHKLFKLACWRFQDDVKLWLSHIEFCKKRKDKGPVGNMFTRMLQIHNKKPGLWVMAAQWEMEECLSMENARGLLQRGLRFNPTAKELWLEYFRMELLNADKLRKRRNILGLAGMNSDEVDLSDAVVEGTVAKIVLHKALDTVSNDVAFCLSFLPICRLFEFTEEIENTVFDCLNVHHGTCEQAWQAKALRSLQRAPLVIPPDLNRKERGKLLVQYEDEAVVVFDEAVQEINTEKMWTTYAEFCLERLKLKSSTKTCHKRLERTVSVFQRACDQRKLSAKLYQQWVELLLQTGQVHDVKEVLSEALNHHPQSVELWVAKLQHYIAIDTTADDVKEMLSKAIAGVREQDSFPLYKLALEWSILICPDYAKTMLENGVYKSKEVSLPIKESYLEWASLNHDLHYVRDVYQRLVASQPLSVEFYTKYIHIENSQPKPKMKRLRQAYEDALREFGTKHTDLWLDYIKLEMNHAKGKPGNVGTLHWRALKALDGTLTDAFITQYTLLQTGHSS